jgi:hypothetical protein
MVHLQNHTRIDGDSDYLPRYTQRSIVHHQEESVICPNKTRTDYYPGIPQGVVMPLAVPQTHVRGVTACHLLAMAPAFAQEIFNVYAGYELEGAETLH